MKKFYTARNYLIFKTIMLEQKEFIKNFKIIEINMDKIKKDWYVLSNKEKDAYKYLYMLDFNKEELEEYCGDDEDEEI